MFSGKIYTPETNFIAGRDGRDKSQLWELLVEIENTKTMIITWRNTKTNKKNALGDDEPLSYSNCHMATFPSAII